jgi:hypothetical protein
MQRVKARQTCVVARRKLEGRASRHDSCRLDPDQGPARQHVIWPAVQIENAQDLKPDCANAEFVAVAQNKTARTARTNMAAPPILRSGMIAARRQAFCERSLAV